jgi:hypothetical protein
MGKKRTTRLNNIREEELMDIVRITQQNNNKFFIEIEDHITQDVAEAVAILMRRKDIDKSIWMREITVDLDFYEPRKCLYWLTGGDNEWVKLHNYKKSWSDCETIFVDEFDFVIRWILKKSKNLNDIKEGFIEHLNLPVIYEFALSQNLIK